MTLISNFRYYLYGTSTSNQYYYFIVRILVISIIRIIPSDSDLWASARRSDMAKAIEAGRVLIAARVERMRRLALELR